MVASHAERIRELLARQVVPEVQIEDELVAVLEAVRRVMKVTFGLLGMQTIEKL